jgi:hypothetical protein
MSKNNISKQKAHRAIHQEVKLLDTEEQALMQSIECGEWRPAKNRKKEIAAAQHYARATFRKDQKI